MTQKIVPSLWFDNQAVEVAEYYVELFDNSRIVSSTRYPDVGQEIHGQVAGTTLTVTIELNGFNFILMNGGPAFQVNPSISFILNFNAAHFDDPDAALHRYWDALTVDGETRMPLGDYGFSPKFGWVTDKFGVSWHLMLTDDAWAQRPFVVPEMMFGGEVSNQAREAIEFYTSVFEAASMGTLTEYPRAFASVKAGSVAFVDFELAGTALAAMDSPVPNPVAFSEGVSLIVNCETQDEIDRYWNALSAVPEAEQCGWLKDRYGVSWQVVPESLGIGFNDDDPATYRDNFKVLMGMGKIDMSKLR